MRHRRLPYNPALLFVRTLPTRALLIRHGLRRATFPAGEGALMPRFR